MTPIRGITRGPRGSPISQENVFNLFIILISLVSTRHCSSEMSKRLNSLSSVLVTWFVRTSSVFCCIFLTMHLDSNDNNKVNLLLVMSYCAIL